MNTCCYLVFCMILTHPVFGTNPDVTLCKYHESRKEMDCSLIDVGKLKGKKYPLNKTETTTLTLQGSKIKELEVDAFTCLSKLQYLNLAQNFLKNLHQGVFSNLKSLIEINLSSNRLKELNQFLFQNVTKLKKLYLDNNEIASITAEDTFFGLKNLYFLTLQNNKLTQFSARVLKSLPSLFRLNLSGNPLKCDCDLRVAMSYCTQNCIETGAICQSPTAYNGESWTVLKHEKWCVYTEDFSSLGIKSFDELTGDQCKSKRCHYEAETRHMDCTEVKLAKVSTGKYPLQDRQLQSISLRASGLNELKPDTFTKFTDLYSIDLGENSLESLDNNLFSAQRKLTHLYLDYNRLTTLSDEKLFLNQKNLELLSLAYNELNYISDKALEPLNSLNTLALQGNPFNCDCNLVPLFIWCESKHILTGAVCKHPQQHSGSSWEVLKSRKKNCMMDPTEEVDVILIVISVCVALTVACCVFIAAWFFWKRTRLQDSPIDQNVTYDDVKSSDCYYETVEDVHNTKEHTSIPPVPPERNAKLTVVPLCENVYDDGGNCRSSGMSGSYIVAKN